MVLAAAGSLALPAATAVAQPQPSISQLQRKLDALKSMEDQAIQQYDETSQLVSSAKQRLAVVSRQVNGNRAQLQRLRSQLAQVAAFAYEDGSMSSVGALLTSSTPQTIMSQAAILQHLSSNRQAELDQVLAADRQYLASQRLAQRTENALSGLEKQRLAKRTSVAAAVRKVAALLSQLTAQQQAALGGGTTTATYYGPTNTLAQRAVAFAYQQLGKPYVWGATGPGSYDCSGLAQAAWASVGVAIPRTTYAQWAALPHIPMSAIKPGDLIYFDGIGHVGMYVGNNMIIDAPQPGEYVELISLAVPWYAQTLDGAARP